MEKKLMTKIAPKTDDEILQERVQTELSNVKNKCKKFNGEVMAFIYRPHLGFADYAIVKMTLKDGVVSKVDDVSDPLAAFEARAHMETKQAYHLEKMRREYPPEFQHV